MFPSLKKILGGFWPFRKWAAGTAKEIAMRLVGTTLKGTTTDCKWPGESWVCIDRPEDDDDVEVEGE
jgi:hypothetical protein